MLVRLLAATALAASTVITSASLATPPAGATTVHQVAATVPAAIGAQPPIPIPPKPVPPDDDE
ncbi:hypothetical protein [Nonomuraea sp. NPDC005650]|uniref:hypothetical protein n=1 Tax=Nonomuraea sp. NPDC005650 TaxID=3157045 RepID=UPI0033A54BE5